MVIGPFFFIQSSDWLTVGGSGGGVIFPWVPLLPKHLMSHHYQRPPPPLVVSLHSIVSDKSVVHKSKIDTCNNLNKRNVSHLPRWHSSSYVCRVHSYRSKNDYNCHIFPSLLHPIYSNKTYNVYVESLSLVR